MCGRYLLRNSLELAAESPWQQYWRDLSVFAPRYNVCPGERSPVIRERDGELVCDLLNWGFRPNWSRHQPVINSRAENLLQSRMFRDSARRRRCLVPADGFYEPRGPKSRGPRPWHLFEFEDARIFALAGIWIEEGFSIITCEANRLIAPIHDRMPLIVEAGHWQQWLDPSLPEAELQMLLAARDYPGMTQRPVSDYVKKPGNEGPRCVEAVASA